MNNERSKDYPMIVYAGRDYYEERLAPHGPVRVVKEKSRNPYRKHRK